MMNTVWAQQKKINRLSKQWQMLKQVFYHNFMRHSDIFAVISVISQLAIQNGKALFSVYYYDE